MSLQVRVASPPVPSPPWLFLVHSGPRRFSPALLSHPIQSLHCREFQVATLPPSSHPTFTLPSVPEALKIPA